MTAAMNAPRGEVGGNSGSLVWRTEIARPETPGRQLSGGGTQTQKRGWAAIGLFSKYHSLSPRSAGTLAAGKKGVAAAGPFLKEHPLSPLSGDALVTGKKGVAAAGFFFTENRLTPLYGPFVSWKVEN